MDLSVDHSSLLPLYYQIREQLRQQIVSGALKPGDALPGETQICAETGVSRMTARQALAQLTFEGLVTRQRGRGTFVAEPKTLLHEMPGQPGSGMSYSEIMGQAGMAAGARVVSQHTIAANAEVASQLRLAVGDPVVRIVRRRSLRGEIMSLETAFYPQRRFPALGEVDLTDTSLYRFLEQHYGEAPAYAIDTLEISVAGLFEAEQLEVREGLPLVLVTTLGHLADGTPVEFTRTIHRGDRFRATLRRSRRS